MTRNPTLADLCAVLKFRPIQTLIVQNIGQTTVRLYGNKRARKPCCVVPPGSTVFVPDDVYARGRGKLLITKAT